MSESIASWITLSALFASIGWYIYQNTDRNINNLMMCAASGLLCFCGGFLISGAIMKMTGSFDSALVPAFLVCMGTAGCATSHSVYKKKQTSQQKTQ
ncbi:MAG: hypothetical protein ACRBB4_06365 [Neptuniibacter sp.]|uniref:hypothetical protein n=1 Tax=Neptuniibacter sp. TaxID=1962643 RepID=UPI003B5C5853